MKTRGAWVKLVKIAGVSVVIASLSFLTASLRLEERSRSTGETFASAPAHGAPRPSSAKEDPRWVNAYGKLPLSFEENQGQTARDVRYVSHGSGYELFLTPQEAVLALQSKTPHDLSPLHRTATIRAFRKAQRPTQLTAVRLRLEGANPDAQITGMDQLPGKANYFIGNDPKKWHTGAPSYTSVKYAGIYPGVDLVFYGNQRQLEYDFVVTPGADPKVIALKLEGPRKMRINSRGDLALTVPGGEVELQKPVVYQRVKGERREIASRYAISADHRVTFAVADYDQSEPLILDPVLNYSTYLGGSLDDFGYAIALDGAGDAFIAGQTTSMDFPAGTKGLGVAAPAGNAGASFVAEVDPTGTKLLYSAYLAGTNSSPNEQAYGVAVDATGKVYVTGQTFSTDFPTASTISGFKQSPNAGNVFGTSYLVKLDPTVNGAGGLIYSTYIGGTNGTQTVGDIGQSVALDAAGIAYVAGYTDSTASTTVTSLPNFPVVNGFQAVLNSPLGNAFLAKIDTTKSGAASLLYSTYLGGTAANSAFLGFGDVAYGVAVDPLNGNAYLAGVTPSTDFPTNGSVAAYQATAPAGNTEGTAFVTQIDTTKAAAPITAQLIYSTYLGGAVFDQARAIALGPNKVAYVTGLTNSSNFPVTPNPGAFSSTGSAFVTLLDTTKAGASSVKYSTYLGGTGADTGFGIQVDTSGNAYVVGTATSTDFGGAGRLKTLGALQPAIPNTLGSPFIAKLNPAGNGPADLLYATYFGGSNGTTADQGYGIAIDSANPPNAYITGLTSSASLPVFPKPPANPSAFQTALNGASDAFVAKLALIPTLAVVPTSLDFGVGTVGVTSAPKIVTLTNNTSSAIAFTGVAVSGGVPVAANADFASPSNTCGASIASGTSCTINVTFTPSVLPPPTPSETATLVITDGDVNSPQNVSLSGTGSAAAPGVGFMPAPPLAFGNQLLNTTSTAKPVTLTNTGNAPLTINSITALGDYAETSTGAGACPIGPVTLLAGANCTINVTFMPTALGARPGTLSVTDNAAGSPHTLALTGTGIAAPPDFGLTGPASIQNVTGGQTLMFNVTVTGVGGFNSPVALSCTGAPALAVCTVASPVTPPVAPPSSIQAQVSMTTKAFIVAPPSAPTPPISPRQIVPLVLVLLLLLSLRWARRRPRLRLAMGAALLLLIAFAGCSSTHTPKGPATLTITGTSGSLTHSVQVPIKVN